MSTVTVRIMMIESAAKELKISPDHLSQLAQDGRVKGTKIAATKGIKRGGARRMGSWMFLREDIEAFKARRESRTNPA